MAAYAPFLRRTLKWYKRVVFHLITATTVVNSLHLFEQINSRKVNINKFKEAVILGLIEAPVTQDDTSRPSTSKGYGRQRCVLKEVGQKRITRKPYAAYARKKG